MWAGPIGRPPSDCIGDEHGSVSNRVGGVTDRALRTLDVPRHRRLREYGQALGLIGEYVALGSGPAWRHGHHWQMSLIAWTHSCTAGELPIRSIVGAGRGMWARHVCQSWVYLYNGAAGGVMTTTLGDVTKKIKAAQLAEHPAGKTVRTESVGEVAWCRRTGPGGDRRWPGRHREPGRALLRCRRGLADARG